ncbi:methyltransferase domain-containing protein [Pseudactinotalea sp. Z1748]|uniref:methyltransferase domain-containing protein n=1 Tax=Pseudactinotalea sp. Z1748 TaxID=3413027 RepID=UPI003C7E7CDA
MPPPRSRSAPGRPTTAVPEALLTTWRAEETGPAQGWDFSALVGRVEESGVPWDLDVLYRERLAGARSVLDMGTGGGEHLLRFVDHLPTDTIATEGWEPNVPIARASLARHGMELVVFAQPNDAPDPVPMPFPDARFDLVLNRHESYHPLEVARVLRPGGYFLTQQVDVREFGEVREALGVGPHAPGVTYGVLRECLLRADLEIVDGSESVGHYAFADIAALVAYLQLIPWQAPADFTVDRYAQALYSLHQRGPARGEPLLAERRRFWLLARKPAPAPEPVEDH